MIKIGNIKTGETPCVKCGAPSVIVIAGDAYCKKHKKEK